MNDEPVKVVWDGVVAPLPPEMPSGVWVSVTLDPYADLEVFVIESLVEFPWPDKVSKRPYTLHRETTRLVTDKATKQTTIEVLRTISKHFEWMARNLEYLEKTGGKHAESNSEEEDRT